MTLSQARGATSDPQLLTIAPELQQHCDAAATALTLDLSDLRSVDNAAIRWLGERLARGDEIFGASPYIRFLLERDQRSSYSLVTTGSRDTGEEGE